MWMHWQSASRCFNPRSHIGSDAFPVVFAVSYSCFNPRSHIGSDSVFPPYRGLYHEFQSTLPYRERRKINRHRYSLKRFQSTLPYRERPQSRTNHLTIFRDYCTIITICSCQHKPYDTNHTYFLSFSCTNAVRISQRLYERLWFALLLSHLII